MLVVINFAHPLTPEQVEKIKQIKGVSEVKIILVPSQVDMSKPLGDQLYEKIVEHVLPALPFREEDWLAGVNIAVIPPELGTSSFLLAREIYLALDIFPDVVVIRRTDDLPPRFEVARIE